MSKTYRQKGRRQTEDLKNQRRNRCKSRRIIDDDRGERNSRDQKNRRDEYEY